LLASSAVLLPPEAFSAYLLNTHITRRINHVAARMKEPKAREPIWYLKALMILVPTGLLS
jgi:hypothetical protein